MNRSAGRARDRQSPTALLETETSRRHDWPLRWLALFGGLAVVAGALAPPFDEAADGSFSVHMLQHVLLINAAAPLLAIGWPLLGARWRPPRVFAALAFLARPVPALVVSTAVLWLWHLPAVYDFALENEGIHVFEHLTFLGAFMCYWRPLVGDPSKPARLATNESRMLYLVVGAMATAPLGALITFSDHVIYPYYAAIASPNGRSPLADQRLGGGMMWLASALIYFLAAIATLRDDEA